MLKPVLLGLAAFAATATGLAVAQDMPPPPGGGRGMMMRADANGDGVITRQEALDEAGKRFDRMDVNHDGRIDQAERDQVAQRMRGMRGMGGDMPPPPPPAPAPKQ